MILDGMRAELGRRLSEAIAAWEVPPLHASMFGPGARGDGDTESDIDVFIVRPDEVEEDDARWRGQLDALATSVRRWTGSHAGMAEVSGRETRRLKQEQPVRRTGRDHPRGSRPIAPPRTQRCGAAQAATRLAHARKFLKDTAQYGMIHLSQRDLAVALRQARSLVGFAAETVNR